MPATVNVNFRTVVHKDSGGMCMGFPDVCLTPAPPAPPIPIPYPNIAMSSDTSGGTTTVTADGNSFMVKGASFSKSSGDEAGSAGGGVASACQMGKAEFTNYSFDVQAEGNNVCRLADLMLLNEQSSPNTPPFPEIQAPLVMIPALATEETTQDWSVDGLAVGDEAPAEE